VPYRRNSAGSSVLRVKLADVEKEWSIRRPFNVSALRFFSTLMKRRMDARSFQHDRRRGSIRFEKIQTIDGSRFRDSAQIGHLFALTRSARATCGSPARGHRHSCRILGRCLRTQDRLGRSRPRPHAFAARGLFSRIDLNGRWRSLGVAVCTASGNRPGEAPSHDALACSGVPLLFLAACSNLPVLGPAKPPAADIPPSIIQESHVQAQPQRTCQRMVEADPCQSACRSYPQPICHVTWRAVRCGSDHFCPQQVSSSVVTARHVVHQERGGKATVRWRLPATRSTMFHRNRCVEPKPPATGRALGDLAVLQVDAKTLSGSLGWLQLGGSCALRPMYSISRRVRHRQSRCSGKSVHPLVRAQFALGMSCASTAASWSRATRAAAIDGQWRLVGPRLRRSRSLLPPIHIEPV